MGEPEGSPPSGRGARLASISRLCSSCERPFSAGKGVPQNFCSDECRLRAPIAASQAKKALNDPQQVVRRFVSM